MSGGLSMPLAQLEQALADARRAWEGVRSEWDDEARQRFAERTWGAINREAPSAIRELAQLAQLVASAHRHVR